jgi:hypothetical protein
MKLYADTPTRRTRQLAGDLLAVAWIAVWVWLALELREQLLRLRAPGEALERAGSSFSGALGEASDRIGEVPVVGDDVSGALRRAGGAGDTVAEAGRSQQEAVEQLALWLPLLMLLLAAGIVLVRRLPGRLAWAREAGAATRALAGPDAAEIFAVRAIAHRPAAELATLPAATVTRWRAGDPDATAALAELQLRALGLRTPDPVRGVPGPG